MPVLYQPVQSNMPDKDGKKKWYPHFVKFRKRIDTQILAEEIAANSSLTPGDVHNVINNLMYHISSHLLNSETVHLDNFGSFTLKAQSDGNGVDTPEEVGPHQINYVKIQFTPVFKRVPGIGIVYPMFKGMKFERIKNWVKKIVK